MQPQGGGRSDGGKLYYRKVALQKNKKFSSAFISEHCELQSLYTPESIEHYFLFLIINLQY